MNEKEKILEAVDIVCLNCVQDTLNNEEICETCPVRELADVIKRN